MGCGPADTEPRGHGVYGRTVRAGIQGHEPADKGTDETCIGKENRPRRERAAPLDDGQCLCPYRPCGEH